MPRQHQLRLLRLPILLLLWLLLQFPAASTAPTPGLRDGRLSPAQRRLLARWMSISGGGGGGIGEFPVSLSPTGPPAACAAAWDGSRRDAWKVRVRTATAASASSGKWTFADAQSFDIAVSSSISVLTPRGASSPTVYLSERFGAFAVGRGWPLGLQHCERLELDELGQEQAAVRIGQVWKPPDQLLLKPDRFSEILHHGYSRKWQLWLRSDTDADSVEALAVRVLDEADQRACSVERRWALTRAAKGDRLVVSVQEFQRDLSPDDEVFRLPTACHRVEL